LSWVRRYFKKQKDFITPVFQLGHGKIPGREIQKAMYFLSLFFWEDAALCKISFARFVVVDQNVLIKIKTKTPWKIS